MAPVAIKNRHCEHSCCSARHQQGSALILVLWVLGLLSMLVASFAFEAHIESRLTSFYRDRTKAEYLARSGLDVAELLVAKMSRIQGKERDEAKAGSDIWYDPAFQLRQGGTVSVVHDLAEAGVGQGLIRLSITPEPARRNINKLTDQTQASDETWERIFDVGGIPQEMWPTLIDSFYDWTDEDDTPRPDGAETDDYYGNLDKPYRARNKANLNTVDELALIKGFTLDILQGGTLSTGMFESDKVVMSGIADMLTTYGDVKVNINAASARVLQTLPDVDAEMAAYIASQRENWVDSTGGERRGFETAGELLAMVPDFPPHAVDLCSFGFEESGIFRITSTGDLNGVLRTIWCIVRFSGGQFTVLRWREDD